MNQARIHQQILQNLNHSVGGVPVKENQELDNAIKEEKIKLIAGAVDQSKTELNSMETTAQTQADQSNTQNTKKPTNKSAV